MDPISYDVTKEKKTTDNDTPMLFEEDGQWELSACQEAEDIEKKYFGCFKSED